MTKISPITDRAAWVVSRFYPKVRKVADAVMPAWIVVDKATVEHASRKDHRNCPVAEACKKSFADLDGIIVSLSTVYLVHGNTAERFRMNADLRRQIRAFDRGGRFRPGEYVLHRPQPTNLLGARKNKPRGPHTTATKTKYRHQTAGVRRRLG